MSPLSRPYAFCPYCAAALTPSSGGRARARCPACGFAHYDNPVPVVSAVVEHDGHQDLIVYLGRISLGTPDKVSAFLTVK